MARTLAVIEGLTLFLVVSVLILGWVQPMVIDWIDLAGVLGQALALSACCIVAFYYNDLYDLRVVRTFGDFAVRLIQAFGVAFILLAGFYTAFPGTRIADGVFFSSFLLIFGVLLPHPGPLLLGDAEPAVPRARPDPGLEPPRRPDRGGDRGAAAPPAAGGRHRARCPRRSRDSARLRRVWPDGRLAQIIDEVRPDRIVVALGERRGRLPVRTLLEPASPV